MLLGYGLLNFSEPVHKPGASESVSECASLLQAILRVASQLCVLSLIGKGCTPGDGKFREFVEVSYCDLAPTLDPDSGGGLTKTSLSMGSRSGMRDCCIFRNHGILICVHGNVARNFRYRAASEPRWVMGMR